MLEHFVQKKVLIWTQIKNYSVVKLTVISCSLTLHVKIIVYTKFRQSI